MKRIWFLIGLFLLAISVSAQENGADGLGDFLYPTMGNGGYDVQHYTLDLTFTPEDSFLIGIASIEAIATQNLISFNLDLRGFDIAEITVNDAPADFNREGDELIITVSEMLSTGEPFLVAVMYSGVPEPMLDEGFPYDLLGWQEFAINYFAAANQPSGAITWYPSNNHPLDKATFSFELTVPQPFVAVANGILRETQVNDDDTRRYIWDMNYPMISYNAMVAIGDFVEVRDDTGSVSLRSYFPSITSSTTVAKYHNIHEMIDFTSDLLGDYPFDVYGIILVPGFTGAIETQTMSILGAAVIYPQEDLNMHELAHQWFGNSLTFSDWHDIWLHEGFATYFEVLWTEHQYGQEAYETYIAALYDKALSDNQPAPGTPTLEQIFQSTVYMRGALVLHALREVVGDDTFFEILHTFYQTYAYSNTSSEDFITIAESISEQDLSALFDAWLYSDSLPELP